MSAVNMTPICYYFYIF